MNKNTIDLEYEERKAAYDDLKWRLDSLKEALQDFKIDPMCVDQEWISYLKEMEIACKQTRKDLKKVDYFKVDESMNK